MKAEDFLREWQNHSGITLIGVSKRLFLRECERILYLDDADLKSALLAAEKRQDYRLSYIETVALHLRHSLRKSRLKRPSLKTTGPHPA